MELMMSSWYLLVLFMALPMFLAECYVVSEILLFLKGADQCPRLQVFNTVSAIASATIILVLAVIAAAYFPEFRILNTNQSFGSPRGS